MSGPFRPHICANVLDKNESCIRNSPTQESDLHKNQRRVSKKMSASEASRSGAKSWK